MYLSSRCSLLSPQMLVLKLEETQECPTLCCRSIMEMSVLSEVNPYECQRTKICVSKTIYVISYISYITPVKVWTNCVLK